MVTTVDIFSNNGNRQTDASALSLFWQNGLAAWLSQDLALTAIDIEGDSFNFNLTGVIPNPAAPSNVAVIARKRVVGGRDGRFFLPGISENNVDAAGRLVQNFIPSFNASVATALTDLNNAGVQLRVIQKDLSTPTIVEINARPVCGTMRSRLARR